LFKLGGEKSSPYFFAQILCAVVAQKHAHSDRTELHAALIAGTHAQVAAQKRAHNDRTNVLRSGHYFTWIRA
jgi:hypothetical protein